MKVYRLSELPASRASHIFGGIVPGAFISMGGVSFHPPGDLAHSDEERHVHASEEIFVILQGKAVVHFDDGDQPIAAGDVMVIDPGENHHLESDKDDPCIVVWLDTGPKAHPSQTA